MLQNGGIGLFDNSSNFNFYIPYIHNGTTWKRAIPYIHNGTAWKKSGAAGCLMIPWYDSNNQQMYDSSGNEILVRKMT